MHHNKIYKGLSCALFALLSQPAFAEWSTIDNDISLAKSRAHYDRINKQYSVEVTVTNNSNENIEGPFRLLIETTSIPATSADGFSENNLPYFDIAPQLLAPNESMSVTAHFESQRSRLNFTTSVQQDLPDDLDHDGVIDELDQCPNTEAEAIVDEIGCVAIPEPDDSGITHINFEADGAGANYNWTVFENGSNPVLEVVDNPAQSSTNNSAKVAKFTALLAGQAWAGTESQHGQFGPMTLDASNSTIKIMVYKTVISDVGVKFAIASGGAQPEIKVANTKVNEWEELTFDFSSYIGLVESIDIDQIIIFPDFDFTRSQDNVVYFDNIRFLGDGSNDNSGGDSGNGGGDGSGADTGGDTGSTGDELLSNGSFDDGTEGWSGGTVIAEGDNNVFMANVAAPGNPWDVNLSQAMSLLPDTSYVLSFRAKASVARDILAGLGLYHDPWTNVVETVSLSTEWQSYTYTISTTGFGDDNSRVLFDLGAQAGTVYIDDVSVTLLDNDDSGGDDGDSDSDDTGTGGTNPSSITAINFETDGTGANYNWTVFENGSNPGLEVVDNPAQSSTNNSAKVAKFTALLAGQAWAGTESQHGQFGPMTLDASNSTIKIMVYKTVISDVGVKFAIANGGAQPEIKIANTKINEWEELTFDFSSYIGLVESIDIDQIILFPDFNFARSQDNVVYFDNIRFLGDGSNDDSGGDSGDDGSGGDTGGDTGTAGDELLSNGSFDDGTEGWSGGTVITEGDNNVFMADVAAPGNPWDVNLSQTMSLLPDTSYVLSFRAKASVARDILAGLGLYHDPWTNVVETVSLSTEWQSYTYTINTAGFGDDNSRVLFDLGAQAGTVYIDDVSVTLLESNDSGGDDGDSGNGDTDTGGTTPNENWSLVWNDEFDGSTIDLSKWEHEVNCSGGGNNEQQCYTSNPENSFVDNGLLKIVAKPESNQSLPYSSARLRTKYQGDWKYGRIEVRAKPPKGQGSFPAIWMLPTDNVYGGWPHSGEIDIFESVNLKTINDQGEEEAYVHGNLWYGSSWPNQSNSGAHTSLTDGQNPADGFHTYAIEWEEGEIRWYVDDVLYQTQLRSQVNIDSDGDANGLVHRGWFADYDDAFHWDNSPFDQRFHLILNFAVGGNWAENVNNLGIDSSAFNASNAFEFDYVRVYECSIDPITGQGCASTHDGYIDSIDNGGTLVDGKAPTPIKPSTGIATDLIVFDNVLNESWPAWNCCDDASPSIVTDDGDHEQVVEFAIGATPTVVGFNTTVAEAPAAYDGSPMLSNGWLEFDMKLMSAPYNANANWNLKVEQGGTTSEAIIQIATPTEQWQHYAISLQTLKNAGLTLNGIDVIMIFPDWGEGEGAIFRVDNVTILQGEETGDGDSGSDDDSGADNGPIAGEEIVTNGSFDNGSDDWIGAVNIITEGDNNIFEADVQIAGEPWDVNLSQVLTIVPGQSYVVSFNAKASVARSIIVGLGLNHDPWTNVTETVTLTTQWQSYTYTFTASGFGDDNSRVLFDLGAEVGVVYIDDISVVVQDESAGNDDGSVIEDEFVLISSSLTSDINFSPDTVGEWSTSTQIQGDVIFDSLLSWELTSGGNSPEQGNWGTVLAFQNGIFGDFSLYNRVELKIATSGGYSGGYKLAISGNGVSKEISLPVNEAISTWQTVSIAADDIPVNLSSIDWVAIYGIGGDLGVSTIHVTDFRLIKDEAIAFDSDTESDYIFISSDPNVQSDLIHDGDNYNDSGNIIFGEWSTGTAISEINYAGLDAISLTAGGSWGAVLALQGDISDGSTIDNYDVDIAKFTNIKFKVASQGAFERYALSIVSNVNGNESSQEVGFTLANQSDWNDIDIDLTQYGVNLSNISQMALFGVYDGGSASQRIYITDMIAYDTGKVLPMKDSSDDKFVFFSSTGESSDLIWDGDDFAHNGNITMSEWSTGTTLTSDVIYSGLDAFELTKGNGWGAVLALMGDTYGGVQEYKWDVAQYSTINFKIAAQGTFSEYTIDFIVDGAEFKIPLTVNSSWTEVTLNVADIPLNMSKLTQIAIFGVGGGVGDKIYITDLNIAK